MFDPTEAQARCTIALEFALKAGADAADAIAVASSSEEIQVRLGKLEDVGRSESEHLGLRVFVGQRSASIHATDASDAALMELAGRAVDMARAAPVDQFAGLAPEELLAKEPFPDFDLAAEGEPPPEELKLRALACEDAARAVKGVTNSEGGGAGFGRSTVALATSHGFVGSYRATNHSLGASVVAGVGADKQRDHEHRVAHHAEDLPSPEKIGRIAGERAVARVNPTCMPSKPMPVVFDPRVGNSLLGELVAAMTGPQIARRASFLLDRLEEDLFPATIRIVEEPHRRRGLRSRPFDGEGLATRDGVLVENCRVKGWLTNAASARQLGIGLTGHAVRGVSGAPGVSASNVYLEAGTATPEELMADIKEGVFVTQIFGHGTNPVTGDYSHGASGFRIENGKLARPVAEFTIAGNLLDMFRHMTPASDLEIYRAIDVPTIRIDGMTVAGE
ncbi:MAG TPA: TldD/PmbA family protein [Sphingomonadaceae bacterium]|nr:TldD/PmbA family protein [Sphingomonadaceae bacterium]